MAVQVSHQVLVISYNNHNKKARMTARELIEMAGGLEIPNPFVTTSQYAFTGLEAFCLLCARFRSAVSGSYYFSLLFTYFTSFSI